MRWEYDQTISSYEKENTESESRIKALNDLIEDYSTKIFQQNKIISDLQKQTVNIEKAITSINSSLIDLGITDFSIKKHSENFYKIVRGKNEEKIFRSLSEGEKMIINFLYFIELCKGKKDYYY